MLTYKLSKLIVNNRNKLLILFFSFTFVFLYFAVDRLSIKVVLEEMLPVKAQNVKLIKKYGEQFGGANTTLISFKNINGNIYNVDFLEKYMAVSEKIYFYDGAKRNLIQSLSLRKTKLISGSAGKIEIDALMWPKPPSTEVEMEKFRAGVKAQYRGLLVSDDEKSALIIADYKDDIDYKKLLSFFTEIKSELKDKGIEVSFSGRPVLLGYIYDSLGTTISILFVSLALISLILWAYFRCLLGVFVPLSVACSATVWGFGLMGIMNYNLDPLLILLPAFIFAIVLSHCVQFITRVFDNYKAGMEEKAAVELSLAKIFFPSIGAISTDAAGFTVLMLVGIPSIQALAAICTVWLLAIFPAIIFCAIILLIFKKPLNVRTGLKFVSDSWEAINIQNNYKHIIFISLMLLTFGLYGSTKLTVGDASGSPIFWDNHTFNVDTNKINSNFSGVGTDIMQVFVDGDENTMLDPSTYKIMEELDRYIYQNVKSARSSQSLVPVLKSVNSVLYEGDPSYEFVPENEQAVAFNIYLFRSKGEPGDFAAYTNKEWEVGSLSFPLKNHSADTVDKAIGAVGEYFENNSDEKGINNFEYTGGQIGLAKAVNNEIKISNYKVMGVISLVIFTCLYFLYKSPGLALIVILSLATSNFLTYAFMAFKGIGLSINTLPLAALGIGMGVDFSIYVLDRVKEELDAGHQLYEAIKEAISTSGNAVFVTAVTMIIPLAPWFFLSEMKFQAEMGMLLGLVLFLNMLGAIVLVPALLLEFKPKGIFNKNVENNNTTKIIRG